MEDDGSVELDALTREVKLSEIGVTADFDFYG